MIEQLLPALSVAEDGELTLRAIDGAAKSGLEVASCDTGPGIAEQDLADLFVDGLW